jgi:hypothetical protein
VARGGESGAGDGGRIGCGVRPTSCREGLSAQGGKDSAAGEKRIRQRYGAFERALVGGISAAERLP